jgi:hypothetical protein
MTQNYCRICFENNNLKKFCNCSGTCGYMHIECLEKWLNYKKNNCCEICGYKYNIENINFKFILLCFLKKYYTFIIFHLFILYFIILRFIKNFNLKFLLFLSIIIYLTYKSFLKKWNIIYYHNFKIKII